MSEPKYINVDDAINCIDDITDGIDAAEFTAKWITCATSGTSSPTRRRR